MMAEEADFFMREHGEDDWVCIVIMIGCEDIAALFRKVMLVEDFYAEQRPRNRGNSVTQEGVEHFGVLRWRTFKNLTEPVYAVGDDAIYPFSDEVEEELFRVDRPGIDEDVVGMGFFYQAGGDDAMLDMDS